MLGSLDVYHVGMVVARIDDSMEALHAAFGLDWAPVQERTQEARDASGALLAERIRFTYSVQGPPHLELIESRDQRIWRVGPPGGLHHVGVFADDVAATSAQAAADGIPLEFGGGRGPQPRGFAYHVLPDGLRVEYVDGSRREQFTAWMAGAALPGGGRAA